MGSEDVRLKIIVDNNAPDPLVAEHGFSLFIEVISTPKKILFDTGNHEALGHNISELGIDRSKLTELVLSHGHYDHSGGVADILEGNPNVHVYCHPQATRKRFSEKNDEVKSASMPERSVAALKNHPVSVKTEVADSVQITPDIGLTGYISRRNSFEDTGGLFYLDESCLTIDYIEDDIAMWVKTQRGLVICVGCSHAGIVNTIESILQLSGARHINTIIGGLHLKNSTHERLVKTVARLNNFSIDWIITCHCTGDDAASFLADNLNCQVEEGYAGMQIAI